MDYPISKHQSAVIHQLEGIGPVGNHWAQLAVRSVIRNKVLLDVTELRDPVKLCGRNVI